MTVFFRRTYKAPAIMLAALMLSACNRAAGPVADGGVAEKPPTIDAKKPVTDVATGQPGGEVEAVKATMRKMSSIKDLGGLGPYLSNRSAAAFGMVLMIPLGMIVAFADMGDQLGKSVAQGVGAKPTQSADSQKKMQEMKGLKTDMESVMKKYGVDSSQKPGNEQMKKLESRGREFFADMAGLIDRLSKVSDGKGEGFTKKPGSMDKRIEDMDFQVISPTEVKITDKTKPKDPPARAIVEDGAWRIDFGGLDEFAKQMGASKGDNAGPSPFAAPPGPGKP